jgi:hypothetical protein
MTIEHGFKSKRKSRRIDPIILLVFLTLLLVGCGIKGRFYAKRGTLESLPSVWVQMENPDSLVKGTIAKAQVHTSGYTLIYSVELVSLWHSEIIFQRELPSHLPWGQYIHMEGEHPDNIIVIFNIPDKAEGTTKWIFKISYVWAHVVGATSGTMTFENTSRTDEVEVTLPISDK